MDMEYLAFVRNVPSYETKKKERGKRTRTEARKPHRRMIFNLLVKRRHWSSTSTLDIESNRIKNRKMHTIRSAYDLI